MNIISIVIFLSLFSSVFSLNANANDEKNEYIQDYKEFFPLENEVRDADRISIFFSFASKESYDLLVKKDLIGRLKSLRLKFSLYHVDFYSPFDQYLSNGWYGADKSNLQDQLFYEIFNNIQSGKSPSSELDIRRAFAKAGASYKLFISYYHPINPGAYSRELKRIKMIKELGVTSVPSVYINGKYLINEGVMSTIDDAVPNEYTTILDYFYYQ
ncbi:protein disulfide isomerase I [Yersinia intermedia]|uniref:hypothetical protein n=1 Tax=Yersinia intermedia TaxID=631 RepID=UPI0005DDA014|nr:hypothetical protein [Yersinia intermedia]CND08163.1 protein disulfide isomerase I [Yersinia intermedia]CNH34591.1 protein disulfide isomerase I [Yersinia intermedia]